MKKTLATVLKLLVALAAIAAAAYCVYRYWDCLKALFCSLKEKLQALCSCFGCGCDCDSDCECCCGEFDDFEDL